MPTEFRLPDCLLIAYARIFPTINFSNVHFFEGLPWYVPGNRDGFTLPDALSASDVNVYIQNGHYKPCSSIPGEAEETFLLIAHELVHALQIQDSFAGGLGLFHPFVAGYIACTLANGSFSGEPSNPFENEAYSYANGVAPSGQLRACIEPGGVDPRPLILPCDCSSIPWLTPVVGFIDDLFARCPGIEKRTAATGLGSCISKTGGLNGALIGAGIGALIGFAFGGPFGALIGAAAGALLGYFWGFTSSILGILASAVLSVLGAISEFVENVVNAIEDFFSGDGVGGISLIFSQDGGATFANKLTFERTSEQPTLTVDSTHLYLGWTGTDNRLNAFVAPDQIKNTFDESNEDSGPALSVGFGQVFIVWQDDDNHLHVLTSPPAPNISFQNRQNLGESLGGDVTPGLAFGQGRMYLAFIDDDEQIHIRSSVDGVTWTPSIRANEKSGTDGTPALAFGNGRLYLAWAGTDDENHVNVKAFSPLPDGSLQQVSKNTLPHRSSDDAGPALAFGQVNGQNRLFLAWTDDNARVNFSFSDDANAQAFSTPIILGNSSDNAGPALAFGTGAAFGASGLVSVAWVDKG
jgi:hypothetical protein